MGLYLTPTHKVRRTYTTGNRVTPQTKRYWSERVAQRRATEERHRAERRARNIARRKRKKAPTTEAPSRVDPFRLPKLFFGGVNMLNVNAARIRLAKLAESGHPAAVRANNLSMRMAPVGPRTDSVDTIGDDLSVMTWEL